MGYCNMMMLTPVDQYYISFNFPENFWISEVPPPPLFFRLSRMNKI